MSGRIIFNTDMDTSIIPTQDFLDCRRDGVPRTEMNVRWEGPRTLDWNWMPVQTVTTLTMAFLGAGTPARSAKGVDCVIGGPWDINFAKPPIE